MCSKNSTFEMTRPSLSTPPSGRNSSLRGRRELKNESRGGKLACIASKVDKCGGDYLFWSGVHGITGIRSHTILGNTAPVLAHAKIIADKSTIQVNNQPHAA